MTVLDLMVELAKLPMSARVLGAIPNKFGVYDVLAAVPGSSIDNIVYLTLNLMSAAELRGLGGRE